MLRDLLLEDLPVLSISTILYHKTQRNADGTPVRWRVNGICKAWKRKLENARLPVKHGLWNYDYVTSDCVNQLQIEA